ncbi:hypothetical protein R1sor_007807 [Riccia sorocarpa]|uniref:MYB transcription factor n=1 Tax=Riccia sorocarpa TaxID=122646 RepID=A0ABD3HT97_9MARC
MGAPKQKWTAEEEAALRAGVEKYGPGKWRAIQKDSKFGPCLTSRSNVDLKDKWRNMSVSANGLGSSRERKSLSLTGGSGLMTLMEEAVAVSPLQSVSPDGVAETKPLLITSGPGHKTADRKSLGPRYDDIVVEAVLGLKDPNGSSNASIASYIEDRHPVPSNFRRLLTSKLKALALQGKLIKVKQNYKVNTGNVVETPVEGRPVKNTRPRRPDGPPPPAPVVTPVATADDSRRTPRFPRDPAKSMRGAIGIKRPKTVDAEFARTKMKTAEEAARAAVQAVAEAEQAAAAAEQAAREAEAAEAEAEAAEAAAEAAAAAIRPPKKFRAMTMARAEEVFVKG